MAKFINIVTGNKLEVHDSLTIALMTKSERYMEDKESVKKAKTSADSSEKEAAPSKTEG